jgi:hypothetical protein
VRFPSIRRRHTILHRLAGLSTAVALVISTIGIPLPSALVKDYSEPFPCMNCACGCVNAEMCWRECCCFNTQQKLAWARRNGVKVPSYLLAQAADEAHSHSDNCASPEHQQNDLAFLKPCCRERVLAARQAMCCEKRADCCEKRSVAGGVLAIQALKCQGNSLALSLLPPSLPVSELSNELPLLPQEIASSCMPNFYKPPFYDAVVPPPQRAC